MQNVDELIAAGMEKLGNVPTGAGGAVAAASAGATATAVEAAPAAAEEKVVINYFVNCKLNS